MGKDERATKRAQKQASKRMKQAEREANKVKRGFTGRGLILLIAVALLLAVILGALSFKALYLTNPAEKPIDILKVVLTILGGIAATIYLAVRYRTQRISERVENRNAISFLNDQFQKAVDAFGSESHISKISGIYQLVSLADSHPKLYSEKVVNLLCAYIRSYRSKEEIQIEVIVIEEIIKRVENITFPNLSNWSIYSFNFSGATFYTPLKLYEISFETKVYFENCIFLDYFQLSSSKVFYLDFSESFFHHGFFIEDIEKNDYLSISQCKFLHTCIISLPEKSEVVSWEAVFGVPPELTPNGLFSIKGTGERFLNSPLENGKKVFFEKSYESEQSLEECNRIIQTQSDEYFMK